MGKPEEMVPKFAIVVTRDEQQNADYGWLQVTGPLTEANFYMFNADNFRQVAQALHDNIIKAGREMKGKSKLEIVKAVDGNGIRSTAKGR